MKRFFSKFTTAVINDDFEKDHEKSSKSDPSSSADEIDEIFFPQNLMYSSEAWTSEYASDPAIWEQLFLKKWASLESQLAIEHCDKKLLGQVQENLLSICSLLVTEINSQPEPSIGPILDHFFNDDILLLVQEWAERFPFYLAPICQVMLIRSYELLVNGTHSQNHCLLVHKPILIPILRLLRWCSDSLRERKLSSQSNHVAKSFVQLLNQIFRRITNDSTLLHFFFFATDKPDCASPLHNNTILNNHPLESRQSEDNRPFLIFNLLLPYLYAPGDVGQLARDAFLLVVSVSKDYDFIAHYVAFESNFCPLLAAGLSGCFSDLPRSLCSALISNGMDLEDFHKLSPMDIDILPELCTFQCALLFCNAIVQVAEKEIVRTLLTYFSGGFLNVFKSSFIEYDGDDLISDVLYFHLCLETITEPALIHSLIKLLIANESNTRGCNILEIILSKMNSSERLCRIVLSLLHTLIELRCEDFMWNTILRYILPFIPLKPNTRKFDANISLNAASFFLRCIPDSARTVKELNSPNTFQDYISTASNSIRETSRSCKKWVFNYDGSTPNSLLNIASTDELLSVRQPFVRLSSARSSYNSTGWNRYFQNRSAHGTFDGDLASFSSDITTLNALGEDESLENQIFYNAEDGNDMSPQFELMTESCLDYFHFAYEGISESEESASLVDASKDGDKTSTAESSVFPSNYSKTQKFKSEFADSVIKKNWVSAKSREEFISWLDELPLADVPFNTSSTPEQNIALIEARYQYLEEFKEERMLSTRETTEKPRINPFKLDFEAMRHPKMAQSGLFLTCTDEKGSGILLECLIETITKMPDHNFMTNLKLLDVINALCSYPQPVFTSYFLYVDAIRTNALIRLTNVISDLKVRIDAYAQGAHNFNELVRRGLTHQAVRPDSERSAFDSEKKRSGRLTHRRYRFAYDQTIAEDRELVCAKNFAYAAIVLSQMSQLLAAYSLCHCPCIEYPRGGRNSFGSHSSRQ